MFQTTLHVVIFSDNFEKLSMQCSEDYVLSFEKVSVRPTTGVIFNWYTSILGDTGQCLDIHKDGVCSW